MNTYQAKRIPLQSILTRLGFEAHHCVKGEWWYVSPFRQETAASFKINPERNVWYDFGAGEGGNVLDFVMKYYQLGTVAQALRALENLEGWTPVIPNTPLATPASLPPPLDTAAMTITKIGPLQNRALVTYLETRQISAEVARPYLQEMYYTRGDKHYFALAFPNRSGGYELRNPYFKGAFGKKDIALVKRESAGGETAIQVFEGFMDFLSLQVHNRQNVPALPALVLNSVALRDRATETLRDLEVTEIQLYLDHDPSGRALTEHFLHAFPGIRVVDQSGLYAGHKDMNAFLQSKNRQLA